MILLNIFSRSRGTAVIIVGFTTFKRFATFHHEMLKKGFYFACSQYETGFICTKITNKDIDACLKAANEVMKNL